MLLDTRAVYPPPLPVDLCESTMKRGSNRADEVVNLQGRTAPVDATVFRAAATEVLARLDRLRPARSRACEQARQRPHQHHLGGNGDFVHHSARIIVLKNGH